MVIASRTAQPKARLMESSEWTSFFVYMDSYEHIKSLSTWPRLMIVIVYPS